MLKKAELAEIENFADRRLGVGNDLDQVERGFVGKLLSFGDLDDAAIVPLGVDQLNLVGANVAVDARPPFLRGRLGFHGTTNG